MSQSIASLSLSLPSVFYSHCLFATCMIHCLFLTLYFGLRFGTVCYLDFLPVIEHLPVYWITILCSALLCTSAANKSLHMDSTTPPSQSTLQNTSPDQNPAEMSQLQAAFAYQNEMITEFQTQLTSLRAANDHLTRYIQSLPSTRHEAVRFSLPDKFDGTAEKCKGFIRQCSIYFDNQPEAFVRDTTKCSFVMSLFTGKALEWASAVWDQDEMLRTSFAYFCKQIREVFEYPAGGRDVSMQLVELCQNNRTVAEYAVDFRTIAAQSGWNETALKPMFKRGLHPKIQAEIACKDMDMDLHELISMAIRIDNLLRNTPLSPFATSTSAMNSSENMEPMQIGFTLNYCATCAQPGRLHVALVLDSTRYCDISVKRERHERNNVSV